MRSRVLRTLLQLLLPLTLAVAAMAAPEEPLSLPVHRLPLAGALSQNSVASMLQDRSGLMWFATQDSVNVYDGYSFRVLSADPRDPNALSGAIVSTLFQDRDGQMWIAGSLGWLDRLDPRTGKIRHFPRQLYGSPDGPGSLLNTGFYQAPGGVLWIGTSQGLHSYDPATDKLQLHADAAGGRAPLANIRGIAPASNGRLWLASLTGLYRFNPVTRALESFRYDSRDPRSLPSDAINRLHLDPDGTLWIGTQGGLARWDGEGKGFTRFLHDPANPHSLGGSWVTDILRDRQGRLWVSCTTGGGLSLLRDDGFQVFRNNKDDPDSISLNDIWTLFEDRSGLIWIGTGGGGLNQLNPSTHRFHTLRSIPFNKNSLTSGFVWGIEEDQDHHIWMATLGGLERYQPQDGQFTLYTPVPGDVGGNQLQSVHIDRSGRFWVGAVNGRLYRFDPTSGLFTLVRDPNRTGESFSSDRIWHLAEDRDGRIWLSTPTELVALDPKSATIVERIPATPQIPLASAMLRTSLVDSDGTFWLGGAGAGLIRYQRGKGVTAVLGHIPGDPHSLSDIGIRSLYESPDGDLWVGTQNGLNRMGAADRRAARNRFTLYTTADGLPDNTVYGILPDRAGHIWLSTNRGLSQLDLASGHVQSFDSRDGLVTDEMNGGAERVSSDGTFYFGGVSGVSWFRPDEMPRNNYVPPVRITDIEVLGKPPAGVLGALESIDVSYNENTISLMFAAMDFHQPARNRFRYRLVGESETWTETSSNSVSLAKLADGNYRFEVLGSNNDGVWSKTPAHLDIVVRPPWWRTKVAYGLYLLAFVGLVLFYDRVQRRKLKRERDFSESLASAHSLAEANHQMALRYAQFDNLTQLPNRASLLDALGRYMRFARSQKRQMALLLINLDRFQRINDTIGHNLGDLVLKVTAEQMQQAKADDDYLARAGSDEFALISIQPPGIDEKGWLEALRTRIAAAIGEPHVHHDPPLSMTASIGVTFHHDNSDTPSDLLGYANIAMHAAKRAGGNRLHRYVPGMIESARERLSIEGRIRNALDAGEFVPWFQPLIDLRSNRIAGFEALIRWQPPGKRMIFPDQFIPIAEESGLIVEIGDFMIREVCRQLAIWKRRDIHVAVNVSMRQLRSGTLIATIRDALARHSVPAHCLKLEITESTMMENVGDTAEQLREIKKLGVGISIDDFGTGFSSMSHLKMLPVDEMKIDRSFVSDVATSPHSQKIVNSIVRLAHELQLVVVAEGVEDEKVLAYLRSINCDYAQGYFFGKPKPADPVIVEWMEPVRVVA
ncbi:MAG TPA: EAL domain-containing protein [Xanthomonadaceae bacterium]|nr:EAL domain-containing protein [Xanthomonadaceae bacterium]